MRATDLAFALRLPRGQCLADLQRATTTDEDKSAAMSIRTPGRLLCRA
jgi:hypothetical protein